MFWTMTDGLIEFLRVDPDWQGPSTAVGEQNHLLREMLAEKIAEQLQDRPDLIDKVIPKYPMGGKRSVRDNGVWIAALKRDNVDLVTDPIRAITPTGIVGASGVERPCDVLIYGTGFHASDFLRTFKVVGRDGRELHQDVWKGDARAYLGMTMPNFPNFFILYGPNTNIVVNGSIMFFSECSVRYIVGCLKLLASGAARSLTVREDVFGAFNEKVDAANQGMAWAAPQVSSWYKNATGRVSQNWPFALVDYWNATLKPDPADFEPA
jgi:4-hydroxyacetophenone monooxygenase